MGCRRTRFLAFDLCSPPSFDPMSPRFSVPDATRTTTANAGRGGSRYSPQKVNVILEQMGG